VVFLHTDFRIYWPARLASLNEYLWGKGIELRVIEIAGKGSPYEFAVASTRPNWWDCLFPEAKMEDLDMKLVRRAVVDKLDQLQPEVVFAGAIAFPSGANAVYWATKNRKKVVIFDDARLEDVPRNAIVNWVKKQVYTSVDAILCPAPAWDDTFEYFGFTKEQLFYGINVVDNDFWQEKVDESAFTVLNLPNNFILAVGRQIPKKNFLFLLKAYARYCETSQNPPHLVLVGEGEQRIELERFVVANKLDRVVFLPFQSQEALRYIYHKASLFILPSLHGETWGLVVNEAMASGLPVLVSNQVGCASTLVTSGLNGYTFDPIDTEDLVRKLSRLLGLSDQERMDMGNKSKEMIAQWGLEQFCGGANAALNTVFATKNRGTNLISKLLQILWLGRYRPV